MNQAVRSALVGGVLAVLAAIAGVTGQHVSVSPAATVSVASSCDGDIVGPTRPLLGGENGHDMAWQSC